MTSNNLNKKKRTIINLFRRYLVNAAGMLLFWAGFFRPGFGTDTIGQAWRPLININAAFQYGRYLTYAINIIAYRLGYRMDEQYKSTFLIFVLMLALSVTIIQLIFQPVCFDQATIMDSEIGTVSKGSFLYALGLWALSMIPLANVLFSEMCMFPETMIGYSLCYVTAALSAYFICRMSGVKGWGIGIIFLVISCMFYQNGVIFSSILILLYFYFEFWNSAESASGTAAQVPFLKQRFNLYILKSIAAVTAALVAGFINIKAQDFLEYTKLGNGAPKSRNYAGIIENLSQLRSYLKAFFATSLQMLPRIYLPLLFLLASNIVILIVLLKNKKYFQVGMTIFTECAMFALVCGIPLLMEEFHFTPRLVFPMYEVLAAVALISIVEAKHSNMSIKMKENCLQLLPLFCIAFFAIQMFFTDQIAVNHYLSNRQDLIYASLVHQKIRKYEAESGIKVTKVATVNDSLCTHYYDGIYYTWDQINERVIGLSSYSLLRYTTTDDHDFQLAEMDEDIYALYFKDKNWDTFDLDEQVVIVGDTLYWCAF